MARLLMDAAKVAADRSRWLELRRQGITASEIPAVLGIAPASWEIATPRALYEAKRNGWETGDAAAMLRGRYMEPVAAEMFAARRPHLLVVEGGLYAHDERDWQMATFDRFAIDPVRHGFTDPLDLVRDDLDLLDGAVPVQIKTVGVLRRLADGEDDPDKWGEPGTWRVPRYVLAQVLYEMDVWGAESAEIVVLDISAMRLSVYRVPADEDAIEAMADMRMAAAEFRTRIEAGNPPPVDWTWGTAEALRRLYPVTVERSVVIPRSLARRYKAARFAVRLAERRLGLVANQIRERMGDAKWAVADVGEGGEQVKVLTRSTSRPERIDAPLLREMEPEVAKRFTKEPKTEERLSPGSWAKDNGER